MKIYISEKEIDNNGLNYVEDDFVEEYWLLRGMSQGKSFEVFDDVGLVEIQSLEQHEAETRKPFEEEIESLKNKLADLTEEYELTVEGFDREYAQQNVRLRKAFNDRNSERLKVIAELEKWAENEHKMYIDDLVRFVGSSEFYGTSVKNRLAILKDLKQKLKEMKEVRDEN